MSQPKSEKIDSVTTHYSDLSGELSPIMLTYICTLMYVSAHIILCVHNLFYIYFYYCGCIAYHLFLGCLVHAENSKALILEEMMRNLRG